MKKIKFFDIVLQKIGIFLNLNLVICHHIHLSIAEKLVLQNMEITIVNLKLREILNY